MARLVMIPSISTTVTLFAASLSSVVTSSSRGPTERDRMLLLWARPLVKKFPRLTRTLTASSTHKTSANTIQPRPRRGLGAAAGAARTGGGGVSGGGGGAGGDE